MHPIQRITTLLALAISTTIATAQPCSPADLNADGFLDFIDISVFLNGFTSADPIADLNSDGNHDFLDISQFLTLFGEGCGPVEIVLRDSIGPDSSMTDGMFGLGGELNSFGTGSFVGIDLHPFENIQLNELRVVLVNEGFDPNTRWSEKDYVVMVWDTYSDAMDDPLCGNLNTCMKYVIDSPTIGPTNFGTTSVPFFGDRTTYELVFDLTSFGIVLNKDSQAFFALAVRHDILHSDVLGIMESSESGAMTDRGFISTQGWSFTSDYSDVRADGRAAYSLTGTTIP